MEKAQKNAAARVAFVALALLFCEWFFFRNVIGTGGLFGDRGDGRLTTLLAEHWYRFFTGKEKFFELAMFHPDTNAIGYTDMFLAFGMIHSVLRFLGMNMFRAYKWTLILVHIFGTFSTLYLLRAKLKCGWLWALFGTIAFNYSTSYSRHFGHTQLAAISFLPFLLVLLTGFFQNFANRRRRNAYAYPFLLGFALLTYNSWYVACFSGIFCLFFLIIFFALNAKNKTGFFDEFRAGVKSAWKEALGWLAFLALLYVPFVIIYGRAFRESGGGYSYEHWYLPEPIDIVNVGPSNLVLGKFMRFLRLDERNIGVGEVTIGFSLILLLLFVAMFFIDKKKRAGALPPPPSNPPSRNPRSFPRCF